MPSQDRTAACICGRRDAERDPDATWRVLVPTASDCPSHGLCARCGRLADEHFHVRLHESDPNHEFVSGLS